MGSLHSEKHGGPDNFAAVRVDSQYGALLAMRDEWQRSNQGHLKVYVQDPQYNKTDEAILKEWNITVVNGDVGYQMGACLINPFTLVVDMMSKWRVPQIAFEITRPVGLLTYQPHSGENLADVESKIIYHYIFEPEAGREVHRYPPGTPIEWQEEHMFPGSGV